MDLVERLIALADKDSSDTISVDEINSIFKKINLDIPKKQIANYVKEYNTKELTREQFRDLYSKISEITSFRALYVIIRNGIGFEGFYRDIQKERTISPITNPTYEEFKAYLLRDESRAYSYEKRKLYMDMNQPWYMYYMNSSHNTYLLGNQLSGESSTEAYVRALQLGCRCVELDCWDGPNGEPIITHGFTLTSKVLFHEVVEIIHQYAFNASEYPVVLSLEVHCSVAQQERMAEILKGTLGPMLLSSKLQDGMVVSPENLKKRILLKGRAVGLTEEEIDTESISETENDKDTTKAKISEKLAALIVYQQSKKLHQFDDIHQFENHHVSSFSESKATKMMSNAFEEFLKFTSTAFARYFKTN
jgi:phosphatidylinositol phospholipase C, delta